METGNRRDRQLAKPWQRRLVVAVAALLLPPQLAMAEATPDTGCQAILRAGTTLTLSGQTVRGLKNMFSVEITLELTAGNPTATGVPIVAGSVRSERLKDGGIDWQSPARSRWGNTCMDMPAPDGRLWSLLALTWEDDNAHPNFHGVIDWSAGTGAEVVGFIDTKDGAYHEAQAILSQGTRSKAQSRPRRPESVPEPAPVSLCDSLFSGDESHFFVGRGYATQEGANPGHLAMHFNPRRDSGPAIALSGRYIATEDPQELERHVVTADTSACIDMPDPRYAMLHLSDSRGATMVLWLWGEKGVPQKDDRLMGYVTIPGSPIVRSKVAFWRL